MVKSEKTPYGYIYRATNRVNGKIYIGQTITATWKEHQVPIIIEINCDSGIEIRN